MTQQDIQTYYRDYWKQANTDHAASDQKALVYSSPVEDAAIYPIYEKLIADLGIRINQARVLDIGSGAGRWIRFILERFTPDTLTGVDFAESSVMLLNEWCAGLDTPTKVSFQVADITAPDLALEAGAVAFDTINIANVLFHIPEPEKFERAMSNLASLLAPDGRIITTEYLPRATMRTNWMSVRSRYEFEDACEKAGLAIAEIRACSFFSNDPMGIDGPDAGTRKRFAAVKAMTQQLLGGVTNDQSRQFVTQLFAEIEHACIEFCTERVAHIDMPAQKLVVLRKRS